jgi:AcrR family transcriptional regulator
MEAATKAARWQRRKEARPNEILDAALACFAERGFSATRVDDVAARAGVTKGTLYLYFSGKEELLKALVRQSIIPNIERAEALVAAEDEPCAVILQRILQLWAHAITAPQSAIPKIMIADAGNFPELARFYLEEVASRGMGVVANLLRKGIARGEFRPLDIDHTVFSIISPMLFAMLWRHSLGRHDKRRIDAATLGQAHFDLVCRGLLADGDAARTPCLIPNPPRGHEDGTP